MSSSDPRQFEEAPPVAPGQVLAGKFRIERVIGEGGMGIVAEATHLQLDERVALKFLRREVMRAPDVVARFDREARAAVKLKSEHVAWVMDVGHTEDGIPFIVMEYLEGHDLGHVLAEDGPLSIPDAVELVIQACEGVGEAHARGIVHRDLKPENLFLAQRSDGWRTIKVLDFGISKAVLVGPSSVDPSSHDTSSIMGSPYYMSPEQLRSTRNVDHRADVWSLGVVLFELLTGTTTFDETKEFTELVADILQAPHRRLRAFRPDAPEGLEEIVDRCLEKDKGRRYQNVAELVVALLPYAPRRSRVSAERIASITRAAGLITDASFRLPPSDFPPPGPGARDSTPGDFGVLPLPTFVRSLGSFDTVPAPSPSHASIDESPTLIGAPPALVEQTTSAERRSWIAVLGVVALVGLVFVCFAVRPAKAQHASMPTAGRTDEHPLPTVEIKPMTPRAAEPRLSPPSGPSETANATQAVQPSPSHSSRRSPLAVVRHSNGTRSAQPPAPSTPTPPASSAPPPSQAEVPAPPRAADVLDDRR